MKSLNKYFDRLPLPPDTIEFEVDEESPVSFSLRATYTDRSTDELISFYRHFFQQNGWSIDLELNDQLPGLLVAKKGRISSHITVVAVNDELHFIGIYEENELTHDEFDKKVEESTHPEVIGLITRIRETYGALTSYRDSGTVESIRNGKVLGRSQFATAYRDPGDLLFEHWHATGDFFFSASLITKRGDDVQFMSNYDDAPRSDSIDMAIAAFYGTSGTTSGNIPELLLGLEDSGLFYLSDMTLLEESKLDDGTVCMRIQGRKYGGGRRTIWIVKDDHLIRKIESLRDKHNRKTIHYQPNANPEVADGDFDFHKPVAKRI